MWVDLKFNRSTTYLGWVLVGSSCSSVFFKDLNIQNYRGMNSISVHHSIKVFMRAYNIILSQELLFFCFVSTWWLAVVLVNLFIYQCLSCLLLICLFPMHYVPPISIPSFWRITNNKLQLSASHLIFCFYEHL